MATITIEFSFTDDDVDCKEFEASGNLLAEIEDCAGEMVEERNDDLDDDVDPIDLDGWEVDYTDLDCNSAKDWYDFKDLNEWGEYAERVEEHGEAFVLRHDDWDGHTDLEGYEGCWHTKEEWAQHTVEDCYSCDLPSFVDIDWESTANNMLMDYSTYEGRDGIHIFRD